MKICITTYSTIIGKGVRNYSPLADVFEESDKIKDELMLLLTRMGHTVYDGSVSDEVTTTYKLPALVAKKCNSFDADMVLIITFSNSTRNFQCTVKKPIYDGCSAYTYNGKTCCYKYAKPILYELGKIGYEYRGIHILQNPLIMRLQADALLIKCCYIDSYKDMCHYDPKKIAYAIATAMYRVDNKDKKNKDKIMLPSIEVKPKYDPTRTCRVDAIKAGAIGGTTKCQTFKVKMLRTTPVLAGADINFATVGRVSKDSIQTIIARSGRFGKLEDCSGWVCISKEYAQRIKE